MLDLVGYKLIEVELEWWCLVVIVILTVHILSGDEVLDAVKVYEGEMMAMLQKND